MNSLQAFLLGIIQGLTEFLPVSSSGHLEIGNYLFGVNAHSNLIFAVAVHGATVLSTIVVFRKDIWALLKGLFKFQWNEETRYIAKILFSSVPVVIVGLLFQKEIASLFDSDILFVGAMLLVTATILSFTYFAKSGDKSISFRDALIIGLAQTVAILPGVSRSGSTIATGLLLGNKRESVARFSFLMVLIPIIGANILDIMNGEMSSNDSIGFLPLLVGFIAAFVSGLLACKWMIGIVKKGKLIYFAIYCLIVGLITIFAAGI
ncbi:MAG: UDP-diphosphatase [Bacteroidetes bacterium GWF2_42_66]|nr:MAG: UDP-diphosphatase [Bacteroidetes bacterium GWA2_42_15]OFX97883.1 MAG: UDP-diphosphatase [Bacteroidetes bacterium GWE2_42_39]OFY44140.1 MAG: UDP-diphosphatase [Bacteroidetes bacterium GWF2_42_66]HAZ03414.1 UDP-diphosphatase [Marinilabiliales bacterium]HBL74615.1 UDP-diphosphatase [Prolixibacteraceae bacterium]